MLAKSFVVNFNGMFLKIMIFQYFAYFYRHCSEVNADFEKMFQPGVQGILEGLIAVYVATLATKRSILGRYENNEFGRFCTTRDK